MTLVKHPLVTYAPFFKVGVFNARDKFVGSVVSGLSKNKAGKVAANLNAILAQLAVKAIAKSYEQEEQTS